MSSTKVKGGEKENVFEDNRSQRHLISALFVIYVTGLFIRLRTIGDSAAHLDEAYTYWMVGNLELGGNWASDAKLPSLPRWLAVPGYVIGGNGNDVALRSSPLLGWSIMYWSLGALLIRHGMGKGAIATSMILCFEPTIIGYSLYMKEDMVLAGATSLMLLAATTKRKYWTYLVVGLPLASKWTGGIMPLILVIFWSLYLPQWIEQNANWKIRIKEIILWGSKAICTMLVIFVLLNPWYLTHQRSILPELMDSAAFDSEFAKSEECVGSCGKAVLNSEGVWWFYVPFHTMQLTPIFVGLCCIGLLSLLKPSNEMRKIASLGLITWLVCFVTYSLIISVHARHYTPIFLPGLLLIAASGVELLFAMKIVSAILPEDEIIFMKPIGLFALMISSVAWSASIAPEYREWTWGGIEDPYGGSTRTMWEEKLVHEEMRNEVKAYVTTHPEESPRICTNYAVMFIWYEYPEGRRHYWMDSIERHWGNCEFIIYSKYWVGDNLQHEGVEHLYQIWHGAEDERFKAIRPQQCHEVECHLMAFKVLK